MSLSAKAFSIFQRDVFLFFTTLLASVVIARKLGPEAMGIFAILQLIPNYAEGFGRLKFDVASVYFLGKGKYQIGEVLFILNLLTVLSSILIIAPIIWKFGWIYDLLFHGTTQNVSWLVYCVLLQIPLHFLYMNYSYIHIHREDVKTYNRMVVIQALTSAIISIPALLLFDMGLPVVIFSIILAKLFAVMYGVKGLKKVAKMAPNFNLGLIKDLFTYGGQFYLAGVLGHLTAYTTNLLAVIYLSPSMVAFFSMARNRVELLNKIPGAVSTILYPRISKIDEKETTINLTTRTFRITLILVTIAGILAFILIKPLVYILYGSEYLPMVLPFLIILPAIIAEGSTSIINAYFSGIGRADLLPKIAIIPVILQAAIAVILIPAIGLTGAAISFLITIISLSALRIMVFIRITGCTFWKDICISRDDLKTTLELLKHHVFNRILNGFMRLTMTPAQKSANVMKD